MTPGGLPVFRTTEHALCFADLAMAWILRREVMWWVLMRAWKRVVVVAGLGCMILLEGIRDLVGVEDFCLLSPAYVLGQG